jgi:hypothetical protein
LVTRSEFALAVQTLADFEIQVNKTVALLDKISVDNPKEVLVLVESLSVDFERQASRLELLMAGSPIDMLDELTSAFDLSTAGAAMAREVTEEIKDTHNLFTLTPSPDFTLTSTAADELTATATAAKVKTATPVIVVITADPNNSSSDIPDLTSTFTPERRDIKPGLTKTPKPPNENKPEKEENDPKDKKPPKDIKNP